MKAISTLALMAVGAVLMNSTPLRASDADSHIELSFNKPPVYPTHIRYDTIKIAEETSSQVNEQAGFRFQDELGDLLAPQVRPELGVYPVTVYAAKIELMAATPNNVFQSEQFPTIEYSGILVQAFRGNPLQLFNPFAPPQYGDGEANTMRDLITAEPEGLKVLSIRF